MPLNGGGSKSGSSHIVDGKRTSGTHLDAIFHVGPHHLSQDGPILNDISVNSVS